MEFKFDYLGVLFHAVVKKDADFVPTDQELTDLNDDDWNDVKAGEAAFFQVVLTLKRGDNQLSFYYPSIILTDDEEEIPEEFCGFFEEEGILDRLIQILDESKED